MADVIIENPIINSPFEEPKHHFKFSEDGITNEIVESRRLSAYFMPIPRSRKAGAQIELQDQWTLDRLRPSELVNDIRLAIKKWRLGNYQGITPTTRKLLDYWRRSERFHRLFFCQIEALETIIFLTEVAKRYGESRLLERILEANQIGNHEIYRIALKMATGSGKTVVMAMLIAWQALNKFRNPQNPDFSDTFLIVTPGITIKDRLRVLLPQDDNNYYKAHDIVPDDLISELGKIKIVITNFHTFKPREKSQLSNLGKKILRRSQTETKDEMVRRVCRELGTKKNIIVINDEAHHCYRHKVGEEEQEELFEDEKEDAKKREEAARLWINGLEAVKRKIGIRCVYDLSATPFFMKGSGYPESHLFPWVVSDFSLIDAIESGVVKVPRVPVSDDSGTGILPTYREIWSRIRDELPRKGRRTEKLEQDPKLPGELEAALASLYGNYEKAYKDWHKKSLESKDASTPPVFIIVCNNTNVSKLIFDFISGWEKAVGDTTALVPGTCELFNNVKDGQWIKRPVTILVDSEQLDSGEAMSDEFKKIAKQQIEEFKTDIRQRFPGRSVENLEDADLLREVMNTVGKPGKLGEGVRCVVSVSMLTEGWDANTVTHILGVRAFGTQLLCEQVVGRGLRRREYETDIREITVNGNKIEIESFPLEYAEIYGVPFQFIPCAGGPVEVHPKKITHVKALPERIASRITFPRVTGYRYKLADEHLKAEFTDSSTYILDTKSIPTEVEVATIVGGDEIHKLDILLNKREQEVVFLLAKLILERYFKEGEDTKHWFFPDLLQICRQWMADCLILHDNTYPQLLLIKENALRATDRIYNAIVHSSSGEKTLLPILAYYDPQGSTDHVDFDTRKPCYQTKEKCHISHVVGDTEDWEQHLAQGLEDMPEVLAYVNNAFGKSITGEKTSYLQFKIPYLFEGEEQNYLPDFICRIDDGHGTDDQLNLIIELTGETRPKKLAKVDATQNVWIPAVNNYGEFGRWAFLELHNPWNAQTEIHEFLIILNQQG